MAEEQFLSPGVFTEERDLTFLPQGIQEISGAFVGRTAKGPAFEPVLVDSPRDYIETFGDSDFYTDFAVPNYLEDAGSAYVVRLLGSEGFESEAVELQLPAGALATMPDDPDQDMTIGVLVPTRTLREDNNRLVGASITANADEPDNFTLELETASIGQSVTELVNTFDATADLNGTPTDAAFADGGSKLYILTTGAAEVVEFDLGTAWDTSTAAVGATLDVSTEDSAPQDLVVADSGNKLYIVGNDTPASVFEYDFGTPFDLSTATYSTNSFDVSSETSAPTGLDIDNDGDTLIVSGSGSTIYQYTLGTPFDITTTSFNAGDSYMNTNELTSISSVDFIDSGDKLLVADSSDDTAHSFGLSSAYDITSGVGFGGDLDLSGDVDDLVGLVGDVAEGSIFAVDATNSSILDYEIGLVNGTRTFDTLGEFPDTVSYVLSLNEGDDNYVLDFFGSSVDGVREVYFEAKFPNLWAEIIDEAGGGTLLQDLTVEFDALQVDFDGQQYSNASTPWIVSQDQQPAQPGTDRQRLFRFHTLSDGNSSNREIKVSLQSIRYPEEVSGSEYGTFDVIVRAFDDSDRNPEVLESFTGVNLDPSSDNFIASVIGNKNQVFQNDKLRQLGEFENNSNYIRVEVDDQLRSANGGNRDELSHLIPWGFESYQIPLQVKDQISGLKPRRINTVNDPDTEVIDVTNTLTQDIQNDVDPNTAIFDNRINYGFDFEFEDNETFLNPVAENAEPLSDQQGLSQNFDFVFSDGFVNNDGTIESIDFGDGPDEGFPIQSRKLAVGFQGGFDGQDPTTPIALGEDITSSNSQGLDLSGFNTQGAEAYRDAFRILSNDDRFDINLLVTPGVIYDLHQTVVQSGLDMVEARGDVFYVFDQTGPDASIQEATNSIQTLDTNYAATYYPWVRVRERDTGRQREVPPSVVIPRVYAFSDRNSAEWFAPAGLERGGIPEVIEPVVRLRKDERDELYSNRINPIAEFQGQGTVVFGQKTLQVAPSALDRVNVRRLLIRVKKFVASTSRFLVFEQNVPATRNRFKNIVNPFLENIQQRQGLFAFRVEMDADNNPPEVIDRNELRGQIFLQPTRTAEFVSIQFNLLPTGAEFENI